MRSNRLRKWTLTVPLAIFLCTCLCACGQKGKLILPPSDAAPMTITPQTFPEPETDESESEKVPLGIRPARLPI